MSAAIQQAAISYFGLPEGTQMVEGGPLGCFAFVIPLTEEHMRGIADRMKALSEPIHTEPGWTAPLKTRDELRSEYNAMSIKERGRFGSFNQYCIESTMGLVQDDAIEPEAQGAGGRKVMHVNAPEEEQSALPEAVWLPSKEITHEQRIMMSDSKAVDGKPWCLVQVAMLTEDQRNKYAKGGA